MVHDQDLVSIQEVRSKVDKAWAAWQDYKKFSQEQVDAIVEAVAAAGRANARELARMAVEETGMGTVEDKVAKNLLNADLLPRSIRGMKTVGILREIPEKKIVEIGVPVGVIAAILPTTNPTSTAIYKTIISLKAGNAIVMSPHPRAKNCTCHTAQLLSDAATKAGAPADLVQCIGAATLDGTNALMKHPKTALILSTGGAGIVKAAYSSGKPAFGVGPGNVPILIDSRADVPDAVQKVVVGKSFDYGTVCSSEQTVVAERSIRDQVLAELKNSNAYILSTAERAAIEKVLFVRGVTVNPDCVGQSPKKIAQMAGITIPAEARILVAEIEGVGKEHPLSAEKLSPVLAVLFVPDFQAAVAACDAILHFGGLGHTCVIHSKDDSRVREYGLKMNAFRILVNTPAPQGSVGITTALQPSMTLGCGAMAGNSTSDNVGPRHLMNIKRIAYVVRTPEEAFPDSPPAPAPQPALKAATIDRSTVVNAVEKYLAQRGIAVQAPPAAATPRTPAAAPPRATISDVVDRFLARKHTAAPAAAPSCGCTGGGAPCATKPKPSAEPPEEKPLPPAPPVNIVDFVCESDVRQAITQSKKIFIGPKTIVTPAARELAAPGEILILAQR
ncbi:MAG: aldehyde dehydrogenase family protein [Bryobacterales bacterium]|nr:aldehyde dehydrogenase family protein [Bryobacterales bacterium]